MQFRFPCLVPAVLSAAAGAVTTGTVTDIAVAGLGLDADEPLERGVHIRLSTAVADLYGEYQFITADATVRSCRPMDSGGWRIGLSIDAMDDESLRRLVTFCHVVYPYRQLRPDGRITKPTPEPAAPADDSAEEVVADSNDPSTAPKCTETIQRTPLAGRQKRATRW